jgi:hypothetical protein
MVKCGVLFEVRTEFLNVVYTSFGSKVLTGIDLRVLLLKPLLHSYVWRLKDAVTSEQNASHSDPN